MVELSLRTLSDLVFHVRERQAGRARLVAIRRKRAREELSTGELIGAVHSLALALEERGLARGDRVAIFAPNQPEWHIVDFACQILGLVSVPLAPGSAPAQVAWMLRNSGCRWAFHAGGERGRTLRRVSDGLAFPLEIVSMDAGGEGLTALLGEGNRQRASRPFELLQGRPQPDDLASIVYTSGPGGEPRGVMLSHRNLVSNFLACAEILPAGPGDVALSFLPLSEVFERTVAHLCFYRGVSIHYCDSVERAPALLRAVRPTLLSAVPRVYERAFLQLRHDLKGRRGVRRRLVLWSLDVGARYEEARRRGLVGPILALQRALADRLVFRRVVRRFGGRLRLPISGGATLERRIAELFQAIGMPIYQGYGLTEATAVVAANHPAAHRPGALGRPLPGCEVRIAEDGEILVRGPGVMLGYWQDDDATAAVLDADGWLATGDLGRFDDDGFLYLTDRKHDVLVTSRGRSVAPRPIEARLTSHGAIAQAVVVGDGCPYPAALLTPDPEAFADELGRLDPAALAAHPRVEERIAAAVAEVNRQLADHERLRRWRLLARPLSAEAGELTPGGEVRRSTVLKRRSRAVAELYPDSQKA